MGGRKEIKGVKNKIGFAFLLFKKCLTWICYNLLSHFSEKNKSPKEQPSGISWQKLEEEFGKPQARWQASFLLNGLWVRQQGTFHSYLM